MLECVSVKVGVCVRVCVRGRKGSISTTTAAHRHSSSVEASVELWSSFKSPASHKVGGFFQQQKLNTTKVDEYKVSV